jgi:hypothetical protein
LDDLVPQQSSHEYEDNVLLRSIGEQLPKVEDVVAGLLDKKARKVFGMQTISWNAESKV